MILYLPRFENTPGTKKIQHDLLEPEVQDQTTNNAEISPALLLASKTLSTIVTVHYRLGTIPTEEEPTKAFYYPTPVHDTITGFDWILANLLPPLSQKQKGWLKHQQLEAKSVEPRLSVYGEGVGGSLAVMLALTEAKYVHALAAFEPVVDWVGLDDFLEREEENTSQRLLSDLESEITIAETKSNTFDLPPTPPSTPTSKRRKPRQRGTPSDFHSLLRTRSTIFRKPADWFDAFASPALFLRSPGRDAPIEWDRYWNFDTRHLGEPIPPNEGSATDISEDEHLSALDSEHESSSETLDTRISDTESENHTNSNNKIQTQLESNKKTTTPPPPLPQKRRKALRSWPPFVIGDNTPAKLPTVRIYTSSSPSLTESTSALCSPEKKKQGRTKKIPPRILHSQAHELATLMRKACFWGMDRESGVAEKRVVVFDVEDVQDSGDDVHAEYDEKHDVSVGSRNQDEDAEEKRRRWKALESVGDWFWEGAPEMKVEAVDAEQEGLIKEE